MERWLADGALPALWSWAPLGDLGEWHGGGTPSKSEPSFWTGGTIPWISPKDMKVSRILDTEDHITPEAVASSATVQVPAGAVVVVTRSGILRHSLPVAVTAVPATLNQDLKALVPSGGIDPNYVMYGLRAFEHEILHSATKTGTTVQSIVFPELLQFKLPLAPLAEQRRIVAEIEKHFTRLDAAVAALERARANLKRYRAAVLKAACEGRLVPTEAELARAEGRDYETGEQLLQRILQERRAKWEAEELAKLRAKGKEPKDDRWKAKYQEPAAPDTSHLPELPEGWCYVAVGQLASVETGATPLRSNAAYYSGGTIPWVTSGALNRPYILDAEERITELALAETNAKVFPAGTLLIAMYGEGRTRGKVSELRIDAATNQACAALMLDGLATRSRPYVKLFFVHNYEALRRLSSGGVQPNLNLSVIRQTVIPLPPLAEQQRIVAEVERRLSVVEELERQVEASLKRAARLRQAILRRAFAGKLVPQDPNDEPASVLLERIRAERAAAAAAEPKRRRGRQAGRNGKRTEPVAKTLPLFGAGGER